VMDGLTATRAIRAREREGTTRTTIVALTAAALDEERANCIAAGMDDFVAKPFRRGELLRMLQQWVPASVSKSADPGNSPPRAVDDDDAVVDVSALESIRSFPGGDRILADAIRMLVDSMPGQLTTMRLLAKGSETDELIRLAHSLKSSTGMLGLCKVSNVMRQIEHASVTMATTDQLTLIDSATKEFALGVQRLREVTQMEIAPTATDDRG
jgi:two-component system, sensor histidine kinase and response regulator